jgi:hypothetical protein
MVPVMSHLQIVGADGLPVSTESGAGLEKPTAEAPPFPKEMDKLLAALHRKNCLFQITLIYPDKQQQNHVVMKTNVPKKGKDFLIETINKNYEAM